ncbi:25594_t:CDS:2, partial [Racocetra persica]
RDLNDLRTDSNNLMESALEDLNEIQQYITFEACETINEEGIGQPEAQVDKIGNGSASEVN